MYATLIIALAAAPEPVRAALLGLLKNVDLGSLSPILPPEILVALLVTVLLPKVPVIAAADSWVREQIEYMASIPYEVRRLAAELERSDVPGSGVTFTIPPTVQERVRQQVQAHELPAGVPGGSNLTSMWTKVSALVGALADWRTDSRLASVCHTCAVSIDEIVQVHEDLVPRVRRCLRAGNAVPVAASGSGTSGAFTDYVDEVERQVKTLLGKAYRTLAAATLRCELSHRGRMARLTKLGFRFEEALDSAPILVAHRLTALYAGLAVGFFAVKLTLAHGKVGQGPGYPLTVALAVAVPLTYVVAVLWAIFLKRSWGGVTRPRGEARPFDAYLLSGLLAAASNLPIALGLAVLSHHVHGSREALNVLDALAKSMVWLLLSFTTAATTAFLIDDQPRALPRQRGGRWSEGAVQGVVTAAIAFLVGNILIDAGLDTAVNLKLHHLVPIAGAIGFTIGVFVPTWYRTPARRQTRQARRPHRLVVAPTPPSRAAA